MFYNLLKIFIALTVFCSITAMTTEERKDLRDMRLTQPPEERMAQGKLPQSKDNIWNTFTSCKINLIEDAKNDVYEYGITYTPEVKAMAGKEITITGFMLPLEATEKFQHFILSKRTPTCPFCPPGQPNEVIDVWTDKPISWDENLVKVKGMLEFINDRKLGMFFKISKAHVN